MAEACPEDSAATLKFVMSSQPNGKQTKAQWFALRVRPKHEKRVAELMGVVGFECFLPLQQVRRRWSQRWQELELPLFPGYVFSCFGREDWARAINVPGVVGAVRFGKTLAVVEQEEIEALRLAESAHCSLEPCSYFPVGQRIQIVDGALTGLTGTVVLDQGRSELVLSVTLLQRSVRVKIERDSLDRVLKAA